MKKYERKSVNLKRKTIQQVQEISDMKDISFSSVVRLGVSEWLNHRYDELTGKV